MNKEIEIYSFRTATVRYSPKKLKVIARHLNSFSLNQAVGLMSVLNKKCSPILVKSFMTIKDNIAKNKNMFEKGLHPDVFVIAGITVEKKYRGHGIRYHARSKFSRTDFNFCRLKVDLKPKIIS